MNSAFAWFVGLVYYEGDILKTMCCVMALIFLIIFILDMVALLKQGMLSTK